TRSVNSSRASLFDSLLFSVPCLTVVHTLSLHDALPISCPPGRVEPLKYRLVMVWKTGGGYRRVADRVGAIGGSVADAPELIRALDRKSTRLNSSHVSISYAVFCLKKKKHTYKE